MSANAIIEALRTARRVLLVTHMRPDGDALGSVIGLRHLLTAAGIKSDIVLFDDVPPRYAFLDDGPALQRWSAEFAAREGKSFDVVAVLDTSSWNQFEPIAPWLRESTARKLVVDHHATRDAVGDVEFIDETSGATAELVLRLADAAGWKPSLAAATALYVGLATDTGWFRFSNTDPRILEAAARMVAVGVQPNLLYERLYLSDAAPRLRLIGRLLSEMTLAADGRVAVLKLPRATMVECGATPAMTDELVNEPQRIGSVIAVVMCTEGENGVINVNLRSKRDIDVAAIARRHGGGGHVRAAGARIAGPIDEVAARMQVELTAALPAP